MHPDTEPQLGSKGQTTNDLLREILATIQDLKSSSHASTSSSLENNGHGGAPRKVEPHGKNVGHSAIREQHGNKLSENARKQIQEEVAEHKIHCAEMMRELDHLIAHYRHIGGDEDVIKSSENLRVKLVGPIEALEEYLEIDSNGDLVNQVPSFQHIRIGLAGSAFGTLLRCVSAFHTSLYHQKHAFYFRDVKLWEDCIKGGLHKISSYSSRSSRTQSSECLEYICIDLLAETEVAMGRVGEELKTFREKALPTFLADEKERATTRYVHITTIATFFSSVTATTLQFSYMQSGSVLGGLVNLFWFLSLVFSVSSGISSLLGMTWTKSSIYNSHTPPKLVRMWFDMAPMVFLVVAAVAFIIGLNLFAYLSLQPQYVALATSILTGLHSLCLLSVTAWFIYHLEHMSTWARWMRETYWFFRFIRWRIVFPFNWLARREWVLHIRRNIYWAFESERRIICVNYDLERRSMRDWPGPYLLSRLVRNLRSSIKKSWGKIKATAFQRFVPFQEKRDCADMELGGDAPGEEIQELHMELTQDEQAEKARNDFARFLEVRFNHREHRDNLMRRIDLWEKGRSDNCDDEWLKQGLGELLWGLPEIIQKFYEEVYPVLSPIRARNRERKEETEQSGSHILTRPSDLRALFVAAGLGDPSQ